MGIPCSRKASKTTGRTPASEVSATARATFSEADGRQHELRCEDMRGLRIHERLASSITNFLRPKDDLTIF